METAKDKTMNKKYAKQIKTTAREHYMESDRLRWFEKIDRDEERLMKSDAKALLRAATALEHGRKTKAQELIQKMDTACRELISVRAYNFVYAK
jgi:hypothetical protein